MGRCAPKNVFPHERRKPAPDETPGAGRDFELAFNITEGEKQDEKNV